MITARLCARLWPERGSAAALWAPNAVRVSESWGTMPFLLSKCRSLLLLLIPLAATLLGGCASKPIESFGAARPLLKPEVYFAGHTHSWGMFETPGGKPTKIIRTETSGRWDGSVLHFEQDIVMEGGSKEHRSWLIRRLDEHHYSATGTGIIGTAHGTAYGNVFHLDFTLDASPGNPLAHVHMSQWMYLQADGVSLVNEDTITKSGVLILDVTELFRKDR